MSQPSLFAVVGHPVSHSLSPRIHRFWYERHDLNAEYQALDLVSETTVEDIQALGRAGYQGLNVTLPHKLSALEAASELSEAARMIGAVNTLARETTDGRTWRGENTDWTGFLWSLDQLTDELPESAVLIGAGGAARGVAYALNQRGLSLTILNRTVEKAQELASELNLTTNKVDDLNAISEVCKGEALVVNTVSLGHSGGALNMPATTNGLFVDISYGVAVTKTLNAAKQAGWRTGDGLPMLIGQAADAFRIWFGIEPDREAALKAARLWTAG